MLVNVPAINKAFGPLLKKGITLLKDGFQVSFAAASYQNWTTSSFNNRVIIFGIVTGVGFDDVGPQFTR